MSYCRWSSDDFQCDVYVYANVSGGITIHVAANRTVIDRDKVPRMPDGWWESGDHEGNARILRERCAYFESCEHRPLDLPQAGESFDLNWRDAASKLIELKGIGYNVPQYAIDAIIEEASAA